MTIKETMSEDPCKSTNIFNDPPAPRKRPVVTEEDIPEQEDLDEEKEDTRTPGEIEDQERENKGCYQCHQRRDE